MSILWSTRNPYPELNDTLRKLRMDSGMVIEDVVYHGGLTRRIIKGIEAGRRRVTVDMLISYSKVFETRISDIFRISDGLKPEDRKFVYVDKLLVHETLGCIRVVNRLTYEQLAEEFECKPKYLKHLEDVGECSYLMNHVKVYSDYFNIPTWEIFKVSQATDDLDTKEMMLKNHYRANFIGKGV